MSVTFQIEPLTGRLAGEIETLAQRHIEEVTVALDHKGPLDVNWAMFFVGQEQGRLLVLTARDGSNLAGYAAVVLNNDQHFKTVLKAQVDNYYLAPEYRAGPVGYEFLKMIDRAMIGTPALVLATTTKSAHDHGTLWRRLGYGPEETRYTKINVKAKQ